MTMLHTVRVDEVRTAAEVTRAYERAMAVEDSILIVENPIG